MPKKSKFSLINVLQIILGLFLLFQGILGILEYNSTGSEVQRFLSGLFGENKSGADLVFSILLLISGVLVLGSAALYTSKRLGRTLTAAAALIWGAYIIYFFFIAHFNADSHFLVWFTSLLKDAAVFLALLVPAFRTK